MRHFLYFSSQAVTSGKFLSGEKNLMRAGRIDIATHFVIHSLFLSHAYRENVKVHLIFYGPPDPPKHIEIQMNESLDLSKKDIGNLIKKLLYKYKEGEKTEVLPGCFIEKKSFLNFINEMIEEKNRIFVLDKRGKDIRNVTIPKKSVFIIGDHNGLPKKELKRLKNITTKVSLGPKTYFASQAVTILNNELDRREIEN